MEDKISADESNKRVVKNTCGFQDVFEEEKKYILKKRISGQNKNEIEPEAKSSEENNKTGKIEINNLFGLALSGGGIRSATLNMGFLNYLNDHGILELADYISSVSGGGFIHSYIQSKLKESGSFNLLFQNSGKTFNQNGFRKLIKGDNETIRENCDYLIPKSKKYLNWTGYLNVYGAVIASFIMNLFWLILLLGFILILAQIPFNNLPFNLPASISILVVVFAVLIFYHYFFYPLRNIHLWSSNSLNYAEGFMILFIVFAFLFILLNAFHTQIESFIKLKPFFKNIPLDILIVLFLFTLFGFFANPNILSLHRYYRDRIANAFIIPFLKKGNKQVKLYEIINENHVNPYPLINTCMNITENKKINKNVTVKKDGKKNDNVYGIETSDYFLLSPKYCGSSLTGYVSTIKEYDDLTFSTAVAASGSAINTMMGNKTNRFIALFIYLFNAVLGYWIKNPAWRNIKVLEWIQRNFKKDFLIKYFTFWPYYLLRGMQGKADHRRGRVNISDGGHIENLGVFELLKRRCKLIIAIDASADSGYNFSDLTNLIVRAREKLGLKITFEKRPEEVIKPCPSSGYSNEHFVKAIVTCLPGTGNCIEDYKGILIYVKSSLKPPQKWSDEGGAADQDEANAFNYKINHPAFPHESTINQFFDPDQWDAYYFLGRFIAQDILMLEEGQNFQDLNCLIDYFGDNMESNRLMKQLSFADDRE